MSADLHAAMRAWAKDVPHCEAAVELAIRAGLVTDTSPWVIFWDEPDGHLAGLDTEGLIASAPHEDHPVALVLHSLIEEEPVRLLEVIQRATPTQMELILAALSQAAGKTRRTGKGFHPWPDQG